MDVIEEFDLSDNGVLSNTALIQAIKIIPDNILFYLPEIKWNPPNTYYKKQIRDIRYYALFRNGRQTITICNLTDARLVFTTKYTYKITRYRNYIRELIHNNHPHIKSIEKDIIRIQPSTFEHNGMLLETPWNIIKRSRGGSEWIDDGINLGFNTPNVFWEYNRKITRCTRSGDYLVHSGHTRNFNHIRCEDMSDAILVEGSLYDVVDFIPAPP